MIDRVSITSFSDELQKIAQEEQPAPVKKKKPDSMGRKALRGYVGGMVLPGVTVQALTGAMNEMSPNVQDASEAATKTRISDVAKRMGVKDFDITHMPEHGAAAGDTKLYGQLGGKFRDGKTTKRRPQFVNIPQGTAEATIAHELGHVKHMKKMPRLWAPLQAASRMLGGKVTSPAASIYSAAKEDPTYGSGLVNLGVSAPYLADELGANYQGTKHMVKRHGWRKGLGGSKHLIPAMGTYAAMGTAPLAITAIRKKLRANKEQKGKEKESGEETLDRSHFVQRLGDEMHQDQR